MREHISKRYPDDSIQGEEGANQKGTSGRVWIIDPLDGTTNFLFGIPAWAISIACQDTEGPLVGCVFDAKRKELFLASRNKGATLNGQQIQVSTRNDLAHSLIATGFSYKSSLRRLQAQQLTSLIPYVRDIRRSGSAALDLAWVSCGRLDGFYESGLGAWDWAAGSLLVTEAGGSFKQTISPHGLEQIVAANSILGSKLEELTTTALE